MSWPTAHGAFVDHAEPLLVEPAAPQVLGIDESRRGRPRWSKNTDGSWSRLERFETNFVNLSGSGGLLGQTAGRTSKSVVAWLDERSEDWKAQVGFVAIDPCAAYRSAVEHALPQAGSGPDGR
jgi:transposase